MTISLSGIAQFGLDNILLATRSRSKVEFLVIQGIRKKIFPDSSRAIGAVPSKEGVFNMFALKSLPSLSVDLDAPEVEALTKALETFEQNEQGPGVSVEMGTWFYPLLDRLREN